MNRQPELFLSHTTRENRDYGLAHCLAPGLQVHDLQVWTAPDSLPAGDVWKNRIVSGEMQQATHFLVIHSAASVAAKWVLKELEMAGRSRK